MEVTLLLILLTLSMTYNGYQYFENKKISTENKKLSEENLYIEKLSDEEKGFIIFAIDMYIDYCEDLGIVSKNKHDQIVSNLQEIKNKIKEE